MPTGMCWCMHANLTIYGFDTDLLKVILELEVGNFFFFHLNAFSSITNWQFWAKWLMKSGGGVCDTESSNRWSKLNCFLRRRFVFSNILTKWSNLCRMGLKWGATIGPANLPSPDQCRIIFIYFFKVHIWFPYPSENFFFNFPPKIKICPDFAAMGPGHLGLLVNMTLNLWWNKIGNDQF